MTEDYDQFAPAALEAQTPLWRLSAEKQRRLLGRVRHVVSDFIGVGGDRHANIREARQKIKETDSVASIVDELGQVQFNELVKWSFLRLEGQREGVS